MKGNLERSVLASLLVVLCLFQPAGGSGRVASGRSQRCVVNERRLKERGGAAHF